MNLVEFGCVGAEIKWDTDLVWQSTFGNVTMGATHKMPGPILHKLHTVGFTPDVLPSIILSALISESAGASKTIY